ncbi:hypothetical protein Tco_0506699 [Tanacetum coccineum]
MIGFATYYVWWHGMEQDVEDFIVLKKYQQVQRKSRIKGKIVSFMKISTSGEVHAKDLTISTYASGGGLILYQAYGNLYATTGRKAHLLGDKQILSVGIFDEDKMANGYEEGTKNCNQDMEMPSRIYATPSEECVTPSGSAVNKEALETLAWRRPLDYL